MDLQLDIDPGLLRAKLASVESYLGLSEAISQAGQAIVITDVEGTILYVNSAFTSMTGYEASEVLGSNPRILKSGTQNPAYYRELWSTIRAGRVWRGDLINRRKDGSTYVESMTIAPVLDSEGNARRFIAVKQDVSEHRKAEESASQLAAIVSSSGEAIYRVTPDGKIRTWNRAAEVLFGYSPDEVLGRPVSMLAPPGRHAEQQELHDGILRGQRMSQFETVRVAKDGRLIDIALSIAPIQDTTGAIVGTAAIARDISDQKRMQQAIRESEAMHRAIFETSQDAILVADVQTGIHVDANPAACRLLGRSLEEIRNLHQTEIHAPETVAAARASFERKRSEPGISQHMVVRPDGTQVPVEISGSSMHDARGRELIVGIVHDLSSRRKAETAQRESEEKFRQFAENVREVFWMMNREGTEILYINPAYEEIWGRSCDSLYRNPMAWLEAIEPEDRERAHARFLRQLAGEKIHSEYRIRTPRGEVKWVSDRAFSIRNKAGEVIRVAGIAEEITERKNAEAELVRQAQHDHLTGLPNRVLVSDRLEASIDRASRSGSMAAVIYVDLDGFKFVNDTLGHEAGDELLKLATERLGSCIRNVDTLARMGGDEFMAALNEINGDEVALEIAERLRVVLHKPFLIAGQEVHVTASIGVAMYPRDGTDVSTLRRNADAAMYGAKRSGKDRVQLFSPAVRDAFAERWELEGELRHAFNQADQFYLEYQPIFKADGQQKTALEALLRWTHPVLGAIPPAKFLPIATETGLIFRIGAWVLKQACQQCRIWQSRQLDGIDLKGVRVAVNVSAAEFARADYVDNALRILEESGLPGHLLDLEVSETVLMRDVDASIGKLASLHSQGIRISIDNFGIGFSSLRLLPRLSVDRIKIDHNFVVELASNPISRSFVQAMVSLAHSLEKGVVVEGVETPEQLAFLREIECEEVQGFLLARPIRIPIWD